MLVLFFIGLQFLQAAEPIDIIFDLDDTLIRWIRSDEADTGYQIPENHKAIRGYRYRVLDGAPEFLQSLAETPNVRISFFSLGGESRNKKLLKALKLPNGKSAFDIAYKILSHEDATIVEKRLYKDLSKVNSDLSRVIIVENDAHSPLPDQQNHVLWVGDKPDHHFDRPLERRKGQNKSLRTSPKDFVQYRNKLARARGILGEVIRLKQQDEIPFENSLKNFAKDFEDFEWYRKGAIEFKKVNPDYHFVSVLEPTSIDCIRGELNRLSLAR